jgi:hypothetical protein
LPAGSERVICDARFVVLMSLWHSIAVVVQLEPRRSSTVSATEPAVVATRTFGAFSESWYAYAGAPLPPPHVDVIPDVDALGSSIPISVPVGGDGLIISPAPHATGLLTNSNGSAAAVQPGSLG